MGEFQSTREGNPQMDNVVSQVTERVLKAHPYVFIFVILVAAALLGYSYRVFAEKVDVDASFAVLQENVDDNVQDLSRQIQAIKSDVKAIDNKIDRAFLEQRLNDLDGEIYRLERIVGTPEGNSRDAVRLDNLKIERTNLERSLQLLPGPPQ